MKRPNRPKIYHICHVDRLPSILAQGALLSDSVMQGQTLLGTVIGMNNIKQRRLTELRLSSHVGLFVGQCVPFYFCPRSIMLYLIYKHNPELTYQNGQEYIIHLEADLYDTVAWANAQRKRWAFTSSNAGAYYVEDYADLAQLDMIDWDAVAAINWQQKKEGKQAEFLLEKDFPWFLITRIGVFNHQIFNDVTNALSANEHKPPIEILTSWYY